MLLILLPGFLGTAGALGGVLSSRLATRFTSASSVPVHSRVGSGLGHRDDLHAVHSDFAVAGIVAEFGGLITGQASPGLWQMIAVAYSAGCWPRWLS